MTKIRLLLNSDFDLKDLGDALVVLSIQIFRDRSRGVLGLPKRWYIENILKRFNMHFCSLCIVLVQKGDTLSKALCPENDNEITKMGKESYVSVVSRWMYAHVYTRFDIALGKYFVSSNDPISRGVNSYNVFQCIRESFLIFLDKCLIEQLH